MESNLQNWLPIDIMFGQEIAVRWLNFGDKRLAEPFLMHTIRTLRAKRPPADERLSALSDLLNTAARHPISPPSGVIFHVSRCGSTFLANALRTSPNVAVLSEARIIGALSQPNITKHSGVRGLNHSSVKEMMSAVVSVYSQRMGENLPAKIILKCHAASILHLAFMRFLFPVTPFLVLVRDPAEVIVSNIQSPAGWVRSRLTRGGSAMFAMSALEAQAISVEEYCARGLGQFCGMAATALDGNCRVVDYDELNLTAVERVASFFQLQLPERDSPELERALNSYAKDPKGEKEYKADKDEKQKLVTPTMREMVARWAQGPYDALKTMMPLMES